ncbi:hypothetical protein SO694_00134072 [Aureococcus anophagefferens]|uniref:Uncharacterized protein n=1 Tax=Aureococcus anophagefferens TaxID=44056 RepID=A0ABR1GG07_AURAN
MAPDVADKLAPHGAGARAAKSRDRGFALLEYLGTHEVGWHGEERPRDGRGPAEPSGEPEERPPPKKRRKAKAESPKAPPPPANGVGGMAWAPAGGGRRRCAAAGPPPKKKRGGGKKKKKAEEAKAGAPPPAPPPEPEPEPEPEPARAACPSSRSGAKAPKMSVSQIPKEKKDGKAAPRARSRAKSDRPRAPSKKADKPKFEMRDLRDQATAKIRSYVAELFRRHAAGDPRRRSTPPRSAAATATSPRPRRRRGPRRRGRRPRPADQGGVRERARLAHDRELAQLAVETCWDDETESEAEALPEGMGPDDGSMTEEAEQHYLSIIKARLEAEVDRLKDLCASADKFAAHRAAARPRGGATSARRAAPRAGEAGVAAART